MLTDIFPFGEWLPDQPELNAGGSIVATNVVTDGKNYKPVGALAAQTPALGGSCLGAYSFLNASGNATTFAAYDTKIKKLASGSWEDVTNTGGDYSTGSEDSWNLTQFGTLVLATNKTDKIQKFDVGTDTDFSDLIASGPDVKCSNFGVVNNFLVCVDVTDSDGDTPNRVRWSPFNDPSGNWTSSQSTQADYEDIETGAPGAGMAVIGSQNFGIIVFRNAIFRMEYVGPPTIFTFHPIEVNRGALMGQSVASDGQRVIYLAEDGFYMFDGEKSIPIGHKKVDNWFFDNFDSQNRHLARAAIDPRGKRYWLTFPSVNGGGVNDKILTYSWADNRFTLIDQGAQQLFRFLSDGFTLEELGAEHSDIESVPFSFDSRFWKGGETSLGAFDTAQKLSLFDGDTLTASLESQEVRPNRNGRSYLRSILPVVEGGTATARVGYRDLLTESESYTSYRGLSSITGQADFELSARYLRAGIQLSGSWDDFQGVRLDAEGAGVI